MPYLLAGPFVALVGIVAVFFVLRRKSVEKRSMYSARRSQIEHKVRAARQRTLAPRSRQKPAEETIPGATEMAPPQMQPTMAYQAPAYEAPPVAPAAPVAPPYEPQEAPGQSPWDVPAAPAAAPAYDYPVAPPAGSRTGYVPARARGHADAAERAGLDACAGARRARGGRGGGILRFGDVRRRLVDRHPGKGIGRVRA
jgi:hypothetical protein